MRTNARPYLTCPANASIQENCMFLNYIGKFSLFFYRKVFFFFFSLDKGYSEAFRDKLVSGPSVALWEGTSLSATLTFKAPAKTGFFFRPVTMLYLDKYFC
jgi:hypothetical protein